MNFLSKIFWNIYKKRVLINSKIKRVRLNVKKKKLNSNLELWNYKRKKRGVTQIIKEKKSGKK